MANRQGYIAERQMILKEHDRQDSVFLSSCFSDRSADGHPIAVGASNWTFQ